MPRARVGDREKDGVVAVGEVGYDSMTRDEDEAWHGRRDPDRALDPIALVGQELPGYEDAGLATAAVALRHQQRRPPEGDEVGPEVVEGLGQALAGGREGVTLDDVGRGAAADTGAHGVGQQGDRALLDDDPDGGVVPLEAAHRVDEGHGHPVVGHQDAEEGGRLLGAVGPACHTGRDEAEQEGEDEPPATVHPRSEPAPPPARKGGSTRSI